MVASRLEHGEGRSIRALLQVLQVVLHVTGVTEAAFTNALPLSSDGELDRYGVQCERDHNPNGAEESLRYAATPGYFETMRLQLKGGRYLDKNDRAGAPLVAMISESFAKREFNGVKQMSLALNQPDRPELREFHENAEAGRLRPLTEGLLVRI